jgi:UDP-N-acetylglucosamine:LPS N-acetylglucosamine transferase
MYTALVSGNRSLATPKTILLWTYMPKSVKKKPRILLAMITVGNGHKAPAEAIRSGIERLYPDQFEIDVPDFTIATGNEDFDRQHKASWDWMLARPSFAYWGQRLMDSLVPVPVMRAYLKRLLASHAKNAAAYVKARDYDLMLATHFFTIQALTIAKLKHGVQAPLIGLNADPFDAHIMWLEPDVDEMICSSDLAKSRLVRKGMPSDKISIFGYPLDLRFLDFHMTQQEARASLGLVPDQLTIIQSAGGEGIGGQLEAFVHAILDSDLPVQYAVACGRNTKLFEDFVALSKRYTGKVKFLPQGYVTNMPTWIAASDLVLGKGGPATTFEALAMGRPIFHTSLVAYNEQMNVDYCIQQGVGKYVPRPSDVVKLLEGFIQNPESLAQITQKVKNLDLKMGTLDIAKHIVETYLKPSNPAS